MCRCRPAASANRTYRKLRITLHTAAVNPFEAQIDQYLAAMMSNVVENAVCEFPTWLHSSHELNEIVHFTVPQALERYLHVVERMLQVRQEFRPV